MSATRASTSSISQGFPKSRSLLAGNNTILSGAYESIASTTVGSGGTANVTFSSIPQTYKHLEVRCFIRDAGTEGTFNIQFNGDSNTANYYRHFLYGDGSAASAGSNSTTRTYTVNALPYNASLANSFGANIITILDYTDTNKYKTIRTLGGWDTNGGGGVILNSNLWKNTAAVNQVLVKIDLTNNIAQYSTIALYGVK